MAVQEACEFIAQKNNCGETPLDEACDVGATWIVQAMLENDHSIFEKVPLAWVKACKKGHASVVRIIIDNYPGSFRDHCIEHQDSPLHHIKLRNLMGYEEFLEIRGMKELINIQDSQGVTPLLKAIQDDNILLTETLLSMDKIRHNIKDKENNTATDLLKKKCKQQHKWMQMCDNVGFDPTIQTKYFQHKANLLDVRNTLALVAALLTTVTFTAGFTLPGGFDQNTGQALLARKAAFLVFLLSDVVAMCSSMLVLIYLMWSMVYDPNKSLVLINRSMGLLIISLYSTLVAFMTGVYVVVSPKSLWAAILVLVMCSFIGILTHMSRLDKLRDKFFYIGKKDNHQDQMRQLEEGNPLLLDRDEESSHVKESSQQHCGEISEHVGESSQQHRGESSQQPRGTSQHGEFVSQIELGEIHIAS